MSAPLIPEPRVNKLGHLVVKHVRADSGSSSSSSAIPAPSLLSGGVSVETIHDDAAFIIDRLQATGNQLFGGPDRFVEDLDPEQKARLAAFLRETDDTGVEAILDGIGITTYGAGTVKSNDIQVFMASLEAYAFARTVDDAYLPGDYNEGATAKGRLFGFARNFIENRSNFRCDEESVADLESAYLVESLGLDREHFRSEGHYYRGLAKLKAMQDDIKPILPLLLALNTAFQGKPRNFYFNDEWYLWENINDIMKFPVEKIIPIARETLARKDYDADFAQRIIDNDSDVLAEGIL